MVHPAANLIWDPTLVDLECVMKGSQFCWQPCLPLANVYEVASSKTVYIMYIQVSQWHQPLIWEFVVVVAVIAVAALMLLLMYTCSLQLRFSISIDHYAWRAAMRCLICLGVLLSRKKTCFASRRLTNTNGVDLNHPRWHPCPLHGWKTYWKESSVGPNMHVESAVSTAWFYGAAPHSWQEPVFVSSGLS